MVEILPSIEERPPPCFPRLPQTNPRRPGNRLYSCLVLKTVAWLHHPFFFDPLFNTRCITATSARKSPARSCEGSTPEVSFLRPASQRTISSPCLWQFNTPKGGSSNRYSVGTNHGGRASKRRRRPG